ncbi:MAG: hypothetical protein H7335_21405 [Massilia sp.]|nr:hypothetical protein [Massilia sp.]
MKKFAKAAFYRLAANSLSRRAIVLDDNNRKQICRLRFNNLDKLFLGVFSDIKAEERCPLKSLDDIYNHADQLRATVCAYLE